MTKQDLEVALGLQGLTCLLAGALLHRALGAGLALLFLMVDLWIVTTLINDRPS